MKRYYKKGDLIQMSNGEWSDYCIGPVFRVTKDFDLKAVVESVPFDNEDYAFSGNEDLVRTESAVRIAIIDAGRLEKLERTELWIGAYGKYYEWEFDE